jgi:phosphoribosylamine--glycine ligase
VGVLYCGLALTSRGIRVIEFNARFGDPETQAVLARLKTPLGGLLLAAAKGELDDAEKLTWRAEAAVAVVLAAANYPGSPATGDVVSGIEAAEALPGVSVLHAGTATNADGDVVSAGGRVLAVVGLGTDLAAARVSAYTGMGHLALPGGQYRKDIALKAERGEVAAAEVAQ